MEAEAEATGTEGGDWDDAPVAEKKKKKAKVQEEEEEEEEEAPKAKKEKKEKKEKKSKKEKQVASPSLCPSSPMARPPLVHPTVSAPTRLLG
jgi:hypothetical protein